MALVVSEGSEGLAGHTDTGVLGTRQASVHAVLVCKSGGGS